MARLSEKAARAERRAMIALVAVFALLAQALAPAVGLSPYDALMDGYQRGVTAADAVDADPVPAELVAVTVNVYGVPFVSPLIVQLVAGVAGDTEVTEHVAALLAVAVYCVIV